MMDEGFSLWVNVSSNIIFAEQEALKSQLQIQNMITLLLVK